MYYLTVIALVLGLVTSIYIATQLDSSNNIVDSFGRLGRRGISKAKTARLYNALFLVLFTALLVFHIIYEYETK